jgi:hypothetical protein
VSFDLPQSAGFLLAGGAALIAQELTPRATQDLDFFTSTGRGDVPAARDAFEQAVRDRAWNVRRIREAPTFCRLVVQGPDEDLLVDIAVDSPPELPPVVILKSLLSRQSASMSGLAVRRRPCRSKGVSQRPVGALLQVWR